jgi:hypothetical protein
MASRQTEALFWSQRYKRIFSVKIHAHIGFFHSFPENWYV